MKLLSVIVPCYNEQEVLPFFYEKIREVADGMRGVLDFEVLLIDDGSGDGTLETMRKLHKKDGMIRYIALSRNFGKEGAMYAGLQNARGDYVVIIDADLQDPPELIPEMHRLITEDGYDCVATRRVTRKGEPPIRSFFARLFYRIMHKISHCDIVDGARDYRMINRKMTDAILSMTEYNRFSKGLFGWVGFKTKWLEYENAKRLAGETKWSFWNLFLYSIDGIIAFSTAPLAVASVFGVLFFVASIAIICFIIAKTLIFDDPVSGWPSTACIIFMVSGIQLFTIGVLGEYLSKTYLESKRRPLYIVREDSYEDDEAGDEQVE